MRVGADSTGPDGARSPAATLDPWLADRAFRGTVEAPIRTVDASVMQHNGDPAFEADTSGCSTPSKARPLSRVAPKCPRPDAGPMVGAGAVRDHHPDRDDLPRTRGVLSGPAPGRPTDPIAACVAVALRGRRPVCDVAGHRPRRDDPAHPISGRASDREPHELARYREGPRSQVSSCSCPSLAPRTGPIARVPSLAQGSPVHVGPRRRAASTRRIRAPLAAVNRAAASTSFTRRSRSR